MNKEDAEPSGSPAASAASASKKKSLKNKSNTEDGDSSAVKKKKTAKVDIAQTLQTPLDKPVHYEDS